MILKYSEIPYLMKSLMLIRACGDIALSPMTFELTLNLYKTIQLGNFKNDLESRKFYIITNKLALHKLYIMYLIP